MVSATPNAERRQRQIAEEIAALGPCLPGNLVERTTRCGSTRCRCHTNPTQLHGPYPTWIRKAGAKTLTRTLSPAQLERYRPLFDNARRLRELTSELETLTAELVEQAEGWTTPRGHPRLQQLQRRHTPDNASLPGLQSRGPYSEDTQIRTPDNGGYTRGREAPGKSRCVKPVRLRPGCRPDRRRCALRRFERRLRSAQ